MKEILVSLSSYNILNSLIPGVVFSFLASKLTSISLIQSDFLVGFFVYYFVGLVINRIGSLIIEPFLKIIKFLKFSDYKDFIKVSKKDDKIGILSETNNMYRTFLTMLLLLIMLKGYLMVTSIWSFLNINKSWIIVVLLIVLFAFSYRKQTKYIKSRVELKK